MKYRLLLFALLFIILSGWYGSWIIATPLLYPFYFFIYGNLGKVLLFSFLSFIFIGRDRLPHFKAAKYDRRNSIFLILTLVLSPLFFSVTSPLHSLSHFSQNIPLALLSHSFIVFLPILLALGIFGYQTIKQFIAYFKKEILICLAIAFVSYFAIFYVWNLWPYLSGIVLQCITFLFNLTHETVVVFPPRTLYVDSFAVTIDQACSGLESFLLFTGLSALIVYVDRRKITVKRFFLFYLLGMVGTFMVNVLRVYVIIWAGLLISPEVAGKLFHTYLGMIFFLLYFGLLLKFTYPWLSKKSK